MQKPYRVNANRNADKIGTIKSLTSIQIAQKEKTALAIILISAEIRTDDKVMPKDAVKKQAQIMATEHATTATVETTTVGHNVMATTKNTARQTQLKTQLQQRYQANKKADLPN